MDGKNLVTVVVLLLIVAAFDLAAPALAANPFEKDVMSLRVYEGLVRKKFGSDYSTDMLHDESIRGLVTNKTVISNPVLEEALAMYARTKDVVYCGESCTVSECSGFSPYCGCWQGYMNPGRFCIDMRRGQ